MPVVDHIFPVGCGFGAQTEGALVEALGAAGAYQGAYEIL